MWIFVGSAPGWRASGFDIGVEVSGLHFRVDVSGLGVAAARCPDQAFVPLSREHGTHKTVKTRFWPWLPGLSP